MAKYLARRLLASLVTLWAIVTLAFFVVRLMPGSVYDDPNLPASVIQMLERQAHLDKPLWAQYGYFLKGVLLEGDWGMSVKIEPGVPAFSVLSKRIPVSFALNLLSLLLAVPLGLLAGVVAALHRGKAADWIISVGVVLFISVPSFVFALLLQYGVAHRLGWLPMLYEPVGSLVLRLRSMLLPVLSLALMPLATLTRYLRGELIEVLATDYMLLARAKGLGRTSAIVRHGLRNSAAPIMTVMIPMLAGLLGGSMVVEGIFSVPGVGGVMIQAVGARDHALTVAALIFYALITVVTTLLVDLVYGLIDPRVRLGVAHDG